MLYPKSLSRICQQLDADGSDHIAALDDHLVCKAQKERPLKNGNKIRVSTTVVEVKIYPTDSEVIANTVRVVTRLVKPGRLLLVRQEQLYKTHAQHKKWVLAINKVLKRRMQETVEEVGRITGEMAAITGKTLKSRPGRVGK